ncbi:MAG: hypothetical protein GEV05_30845 [Betaproteobacteria bacterium]|nr:hypothetical protein [Betaproteobacteria bacterium]
MKFAVLDDYQDAIRRLKCFSRLHDHDVAILRENVKNVAELAARLHDSNAVVLLRERTPVTCELIARFQNLKLLSQTGRGISHIDLKACSEHGVVVCAADVANPSAPAELT